jgi:hypothetical protein
MSPDDSTLLDILTAGILLGTILLVYLGWRRWRQPRSASVSPPSATAATTMSSAHSETRVEIHTPPAVVVPAPAGIPPKNRERGKVARAKKPGLKQEVFFEDAVEVEAGGYEPIFEDLNEGDVVRGIAKEQDNDPFNVYVLDEENYALFCNGDDYDVEFAEEGQAAVQIGFEVKRADTYYFVFDSSGSHIGRVIDVRLKRVIQR